MQFTIGCDPELFIKLGDKYISAYGSLPGTKLEPYEVECGAVQVDGFAFEFNIHPARTPEEFNKNITTVLAQMDEIVKTSIDKDAVLDFVAFANFDKEYFKNAPESAKILGCDPDFNAEGTQNRRPNIMFQPYRTAAGHFHVGWREPAEVDAAHFDDCTYIARHLFRNKFLTNILADDEKNRLRYYGNNGAFRPKPYGIEYRMPSNHWVKTPESRLKAFGKLMTHMETLRS